MKKIADKNGIALRADDIDLCFVMENKLLCINPYINNIFYIVRSSLESEDKEKINKVK